MFSESFKNFQPILLDFGKKKKSNKKKKKKTTDFT